MKTNNIFKKFDMKAKKIEFINKNKVVISDLEDILVNKEITLLREEESIKYCISLLEQTNKKLGVI